MLLSACAPQKKKLKTRFKLVYNLIMAKSWFSFYFENYIKSIYKL